MSLWDTAGQEKYNSMTQTLVRGAAGAFCVFDISNRASLEACISWVRTVTELDEKTTVFMVANKQDLMGSVDTIPERDYQLEADRYNVPCYKTSAVTGEGIQNLILDMAKEVSKKAPVKELEPGKKGCC